MATTRRAATLTAMTTILVGLLTAGTVCAQSLLQDASHPPCNRAQGQASEDRESSAERGIFPRGLVYAPYLADTDRPGSAVLWMQVSDEAIADTGSARMTLKVGGSFGVYRWRSRCPGRALQLDLLAGLDAQFDADTSYDSVGWDGNYGLAVSRRLSDRPMAGALTRTLVAGLDRRHLQPCRLWKNGHASPPLPG